tara:strand:- start:58 stop:459 length:402 start_codon:yes stop_codon:yes gene_type:complete
MGCRRTFPRTTVSLPVKYSVVKWDDSPHDLEKAIVAKANDISARGIGFVHALDLNDKTIKKLQNGSLRLNLEFTLPNEEKPINILARMVHYGEDEDDDEAIKKQCMGVNFIDISEENLSIIDRFVLGNPHSDG